MNIHVKDGVGRRIENVPQVMVVKEKRSGLDGKALIEVVLKGSGLPYETEFRFAPPRRWRADWYVPSLKLLVEYEGLMSAKSRHTTISGYSADTDKYRAASIQGFVLLRYTALNVRCFAADLDVLMQR